MGKQARNEDRRLVRPSAAELEQAIVRIREIGLGTRQNLIVDEGRQGIAVRPENQAMLQSGLDNMIRITDLYFL